MGKHKKKNKKIADHRNEGFQARDAMNEHNAEKTQLINKQIITKEGLKMYTEEEAMEKAGPVTAYNYNDRYSWTMFKSMPEQNQREYIAHLKQKYEGLRVKDLALMFGVSQANITSVIKRLGIKFTKGGAYHTAGREQFRKEMLEMESLFPCSEPVEPEPALYDVHRVSVSCDVNRVSEVLLSIGFFGRVQITAEVIEEKQVV